MTDESQEENGEMKVSEEFEEVFHLSNQALGAIMLALQKGIAEQREVEGLLKDFNLISTEEGLKVENPPQFEASSLEPDPELEEDEDDTPDVFTEEDL